VADSNGLNDAWPKEDIPDVQCLFMRVHRRNQRDGMLNPGAFKDHGDERPGMSTNWCKYSNASHTQRAAKNPSDNGVVQMRVLDIRIIEGLVVEHTPDLSNNNRAHTDVYGDKHDEEVRVKLRRACKWVIAAPQEA
jgi:hypothetical protein